MRVTSQWQRYVISGTPSTDGPDAGIYIAFKSRGELWIDDVEGILNVEAPDSDR
jgi:hypothetical protein